MSVGLYTDKQRPPSVEELRAALGQRLTLWERHVAHLLAAYPAQEDLKFMYGRKYGWALRFRIGNQLLTALYPTQGGFTVQVNLGPEAVERALGMGLGASVQGAIARAHPYPEGRWLFIPVESESDLRDVQQLVALRVETKRLIRGA